MVGLVDLHQNQEAVYNTDPYIHYGWHDYHGGEIGCLSRFIYITKHLSLISLVSVCEGNLLGLSNVNVKMPVAWPATVAFHLCLCRLLVTHAGLLSTLLQCVSNV